MRCVAARWKLAAIFIACPANKRFRYAAASRCFLPHFAIPRCCPPDEIRKAVLHVVQTHLGTGNDEIFTVTSRLFGFRSAGPKIRQVIAGVIDELLTSGTLREREDRFYAC